MLNRKVNFSTILTLSGMMIIGLLCTSVSASVYAADITGGKVMPHVNIAIFHKLHGQESFTFPDHISGRDILGALSGKAQFISLNHTAGLKDGDVITIGNDVLRDEAGKFEDFGVDCQISIHVKDQGVSASGMCEILMFDQNGRQIEHKGMIMPVQIQSGQGWTLAYNSTEDGIAVYIDEEISQE